MFDIKPLKFSTNAKGNVVWDEGITTPFGIQITAMAAQTQALMFPGQYQDLETTGAGVTLSHHWHRTYDPMLGRYLQSDPIGLAGGLNRYAYVGGNPLGYVDPDGLHPGIALAVLREYGKRFALGFLFGIGSESVLQLIKAEGELRCLDRKRIFIAGVGGGLGGLFKTKSPVGVGLKNLRFRKRTKKVVYKALNRPGLRNDFRDIAIQAVESLIASTIIKQTFAEPFDPCRCVSEQKRLKSIPNLRGSYEF